MARPPEPPSVPDIPPLPLTITDLDSSGAGVAHHEGLTVHVAQALPHEQVTARLLHTSQHRRADGTRDAWAELVTISVPSPDRVETVCPAYGRCGGCVLQHFSPSAQGEWKRARVETALAKVLRLAPGAPSVAPCVPSPHAVAYRNQAKYVVGRNAEGRIVLGAYAPRSHDLVDLAGCRLGEEPQDVIAAFLRDWIETHAVRPYDERTRTGLLRYVVIRTNGKGRALVTLITARREFAEGGALANDLLA
ncbi:MAG TPA: hypothetical protein VGG33_08335, partial [Polyangia bacterium]